MEESFLVKKNVIGIDCGKNNSTHKEISSEEGSPEPVGSSDEVLIGVVNPGNVKSLKKASECLGGRRSGC